MIEVFKITHNIYDRTVSNQSGHITSTHLTGDVFTMCFILTMNYTMKISLQQQESFVIRVGLSLSSYTTLDVLTVL